ncbi:aminotransferase class III-fold pyridoxal phosphate-dependent enzyme [Seohaeicola zhoushanensis]
MTTITNHLPTAELQRLDAAHHMHPFTTGDALNKKGARVITKARGVFLTDSEGIEILDGMAGLWCVNIGYGREEMAEAAARQIRELTYYNTFFQTTHVPAIALAAKLAELAPGDLNHVFFAGSGSEANDTNLRMVRTYWAQKGQPERNIVIARKNGYHGSTMGGEAWGHGADPQPGRAADPEHPPHRPAALVCRGWRHEPRGIRAAARAGAGGGDPRIRARAGRGLHRRGGAGRGRVIIPPSTYWPEIQRICKKYDILLIVDEVITGFGRTGNWFACETFGIEPDIITVAKGLSSGYQPIGGSIVGDKVAAVINACEFNHGYTYSGHPVAAAVALENLRILEEEKVLDHVREVAAPYLKAKWEALADHPLVGEAKICGMMGSIALTPDKASRAKFASEEGTVGLICRERCFANSLVMRHVGDRMIISPPLVITPAEIDILIERATKSLDECLAAVKERGLYKAA